MKTKETKKTRNTSGSLAGVIALALILLAALQLILAPAPAAVAAPPAAPTPVANIPGDSDNSLYVVFQSGAVSITADTNTSGKLLQGYEYVDLQTTIDQTVVGTENNTTTLTIQFSNDNSNWDDGPAILSSNAADTTDITRLQLFGRYVRIKQDVTNTNPVTITLLGLAK